LIHDDSILNQAAEKSTRLGIREPVISIPFEPHRPSKQLATQRSRELINQRFLGLVAATMIALLCPGGAAVAGGLLDYLRKYDLNDYALGLAIAGSQSPYLNTESYHYGYPFLTSFRDSALTDGWLFFRDGDTGIRWVNDAGWELGAVGRIQTLGTGSFDDPGLSGIMTRKWTLEVGPTVGWRRWPVHLQLKAYAEAGDRHEGITGELIFSLPRQWQRGYVVPSVDIIFRDAGYSDYYYGVSAAEAMPSRPEYHPGGTQSAALKIRWGYALFDKWLLSGDLGVEFQDDAISASPIIDRSELWSAKIALAYNADIFQPRTSQRTGPRQPRFEIRLGAFSDSIDSNIVRDSSAGVPGSEVDLEQELGLEDSGNILQTDAIIRIGHYHRIEIGYFEMSRNGLTTLSNEITLGDETFAPGTEVSSSFTTKLLRVGYAYSLMNDDQKELGVMAGLHYADFRTIVAAPDTGQREFSNAATPLPVIGVHGAVALGQNLTLGARIQIFRMRFDRFEGSLNYATLDMQRRFGERLSLGLGYNFYAFNLTSSADSSAGTLEVRHQGPVLFAAMYF
jgi:outer membrane protein